MSLTSDCPICRKRIEANTLSALCDAVKACCAKKRVKKHPPAYVPTLVPVPPAHIILPRAIESQNQSTYDHWSVYHRDCDSWRKHIRSQMLGWFGLRFTLSKWSILREYSGRHQEYDYANLVGGAKPLVDRLVEFGIIVDDKPRYFSATYTQTRSKSDQTVLTLESYERGTPH